MTCMCGDPYCASCGPAQGNSQCFNCGAWAADGGCADPKACAEADRLASEQQYLDHLESERLAAEYFAEEEATP